MHPVERVVQPLTFSCSGSLACRADKYANFSALGYHVEPSVRRHAVLGGGVYGIASLYPIPVGIRLPATAKAENLFVWAIAAAPKYRPDHSRFGHVVCTGTEGAADEVCYIGECDYVACFQLKVDLS